MLCKNRKRLQESASADSASHETLECLYFEQKQQEHISIIKEPGSHYFGHLSLQPPVRAEYVQNGILQYLNKNQVNLQNLVVIGCDGTNVNTGWKGGIIRLMETAIGKPLQCSTCLLHANELPLRHLLQSLDGNTKGPYTYSGPIGSLLQICEQMPVVPFNTIECVLPTVTEKYLSCDQQYLYQMCCAIRDGNCSVRLAEKYPSKMSHARWLTTANRLLRLYVATTNPTENLNILTQYIIKVSNKNEVWNNIWDNTYLECH